MWIMSLPGQWSSNFSLDRRSDFSLDLRGAYSYIVERRSKSAKRPFEAGVSMRIDLTGTQIKARKELGI
jgi:hypothetical protein